METDWSFLDRSVNYSGKLHFLCYHLPGVDEGLFILFVLGHIVRNDTKFLYKFFFLIPDVLIHCFKGFFFNNLSQFQRVILEVFIFVERSVIETIVFPDLHFFQWFVHLFFYYFPNWLFLLLKLFGTLQIINSLLVSLGEILQIAYVVSAHFLHLFILSLRALWFFHRPAPIFYFMHCLQSSKSMYTNCWLLIILSACFSGD